MAEAAWQRVAWHLAEPEAAEIVEAARAGCSGDAGNGEAAVTPPLLRAREVLVGAVAAETMGAFVASLLPCFVHVGAQP